MNAGSSELSASCLATMRTRFARRAICEVPSTSFCGSWREMASSHSAVQRRISSSDCWMNAAESIASSHSWRVRPTASAYCRRRFSKCSSAALLDGYVMRMRPAFTSCGVKLSTWPAELSSASESFLLPLLPPAATMRAVWAARAEKPLRFCALSLKFSSRPGVPALANDLREDFLHQLVIKMYGNLRERGPHR